MFDNITQKIKSIANITFIVGIVLSAVLCIAAIENGAALLLGAAFIFFSFWISSIMIYGFGELLEKSKQIAEKTERIEEYTAQLEKLQTEAAERTERSK